MIITTDKRKKPENQFIKDLPFGKMFVYRDEVYVKLRNNPDEPEYCRYTALNLFYEETKSFSSSAIYEEAEFEVVIHDFPYYL